MSASPRPTRKEQQERTRAALLRSAAKVVAAKGLQGASIAEIADDAGFTKGAFYANFESKDALLLAVLDETFSRALGDIEGAIRTNAAVADQAREAGVAWLAQLGRDPEAGRLFLELTVHATRDASFREAFVARQRVMRQRVAAIYEARAADLGIVPSLPFERAAAMTAAMAGGVALARLVDPETVGEDLFGTMLVLFFAGLQATAGQVGEGRDTGDAS